MGRSARKDAHDTSPRNLGRYRLYGELAAGGMATVHLGRQTGSGGFSKLVAIKRLHPQFGKLDEFVEMFLAEARLAARIRHPNVVQPLDVLRVDDEVFLVMEYVEGDSLSRLMKATVVRQDKVPLGVAIAILSGVLRGLHAAHEAKSDKGEPLEIIHRDVSPQNILVGIDGTPRVIDFGIAKAADSVQVTREGELKGKLAYIAPEILSGKRGTRRADTYAAAVVLWEVLTAQRLFDADYQSAIVANILHRPVEPPGDFLPHLPAAVDRVVMKGLARDPSDRYATAREMAIALEEAHPAASPAVVGEWVEHIAAIPLRNRGTRVAQIEAHSIAEDIEEPEEVLSEFVTVSGPDPATAPPPFAPPPFGPSSARGAPPPLRRGSMPPERGPVSQGQFGQGQGTLQGAGPPLPPPRSRTLPPDHGQPAQGPFGLGPASQHSPASGPFSQVPSSNPQGAPPSITFAAADEAAPSWPVPGIAPLPAGATVQMGPKHRSSGGGIVVMTLLVAVLVALAYVALPEYLRRSYVSVAARDGVTLTIDSIEVSFRRVRIVGATATMADLPGFTVHARAIEVWFSYRFEPTEAALHDVLVSIDGSASAVEDSLRRARLAHDFPALREGSLRQVAMDAGHLVWSRALGEGTKLEAENITLEAERNGHDPLGNDLSFATPLLGVTAPDLKLGPWAASGVVDRGLVKLSLTFDPSGASKALCSFVIDRGTLTQADLSLPRSNVALLGWGQAPGARRPEDPFFAEGEAHYAVRSASRVEGSLRVAFSGARIPGALGGTDALIEGHVDGDPARPLDVTRGSFSYGPFRGNISGPVTIGDPFLRADVGLRTGVAHCPPGADVSLAGGVLFDTRSLADARLVVSPSTRCPLRILPP